MLVEKLKNMMKSYFEKLKSYLKIEKLDKSWKKVDNFKSYLNILKVSWKVEVTLKSWKVSWKDEKLKS